MKSNYKNINALTLTELLVAVTIMGVVLIGIIAVDMATRQAQRTSSRGGQVTMQLTALAAHMVNNIAQAVGHQNNPGIIDTPEGGLGNPWLLFIRQDRNDPPTPENYCDDTWVRYITETTGATHYCDNVAYFCPNPPVDVVPNSCVGNNFVDYAELLYDPPLDGGSIRQFEFVANPGNLEFYVALDLRSRFDNSATEDPIRNPEHQIVTRVSPPGHTW